MRKPVKKTVPAGTSAAVSRAYNEAGKRTKKGGMGPTGSGPKYSKENPAPGTDMWYAKKAKEKKKK